MKVLHTKLADAEFRILLPKREMARFLEALEKSSAAAQNAFAHVDVAKTESYEPKDKEEIMRVGADARGWWGHVSCTS